MSSPVLLITRRLPEAVMARAARDYTPRDNEADRAWSADELVERARGCDAILCAPGDPLGADAIERLPGSVRAIATFSVGYEHVDVRAAGARGIAVFNTPGVLTDATAEIALLLMLGAARRAWEGQSMLRAGRWDGWRPTQLLGRTLAGKRLGIVGLGRIGRAVAARARPFGLEVHYHGRRRLPSKLEDGASWHETAGDLLAISDVLSLHCPATPETHHLLDATRIERLPADAIVINTARGAVVDDDALIAALRSRRIAAAGLDVYEGEPDLDPRYLELDNAYLLPHLGSATIETRNAMGFLALDNLDAFFAGAEPPARVV